MYFVQRGGEGSDPQSKLFEFILGELLNLVTKNLILFLVQTLGGREGVWQTLDEIHTFIFFLMMTSLSSYLNNYRVM